MRPASRGDELDTPVRATYGAIEALARTGEIDYGPPWTIADTHALASPAGDATPPLLTLFSGADAIPWTALRFGAVPAPTPPGATEVVVDVARGHVELGSGYTGVGVSAIWHRPVSGALGALAGEARKDVGAQVVVTVEPRKPEAATRVKTLEKAFELAESLSASRSPLPDAEIDVEIRLETSDRLVAPPAESFSPQLKRWRIVAPTFETPRVDGELSIDLDGASLTLEGFLLDGDLRLGKRLASVRLNAITMNAVAKRSLIVHEDAWLLALDARRCILGPIRADLGAAAISLTDCIVDGLGRALAVCGTPSSPTLAPAVARKNRFAPALRAEGTTFVGRVDAEAVDAVDCLFAHGLSVLRTQEGCLRHCYVGPPETSPAHPLRYRCLDDPAPTFVTDAFDAGGYLALDLSRPSPLCLRPATAARSALPPRGASSACRAFATACTSTSRSGSGPLSSSLPGRKHERRLHEGPLRSGDRWTAARMQQGRVLLDHEWNLNIDASVRREQREALDAIGRFGVPRGGGFGVTITTTGATEVSVAAGHMWVGGLLAVAPRSFKYTEQENVALPASGGVLLYLDAFLEHVQPAEAPDELVERRSRRPTRPRAPASATAFASRPRPRRARATRGSRSRRG